MTKTANIIVSTVMWCGIAAYVVLAGIYGSQRRDEIIVKNVRIIVADTAEIKVLTPQKVAHWMGEIERTENEGTAGQNQRFIGQKATVTNTRAIEKTLAQHPEIKRVSVWTDLDSTLNVRVEQRRPMMRVHSSNGFRFWLTDDHYILHDRGEFTAYVPVVTGNIPFPFSRYISGSYDDIRTANRADFIERFTALEAERRNLAAGRQSKRTELRTTRDSGPKRWWSKARKERFKEEKPKKIAEIEAEIKKIDAEIKALVQNKRMLQQKEIFSHQSHIFLAKLANFVEKSLSPSSFWGAEVVQIDVRGRRNSEYAGGSGEESRWQEPEIELVTRTGNHVVKLGKLDGDEDKRLEKLHLFYLDGLRHEGWHEFSTIDIRYKDQIICIR